MNEPVEAANPRSDLIGSTDLKALVLRGGGISAGIIGLLVLLRLMAVSGWNWHTAATVAQTIEIGDIATIALGTLFEQPILTGLVLTLFIPLTAIQLLRQARSEPSQAIALGLLLVGEVALGFTLVVSKQHWWLPVGMAVIAVMLIALDRIEHRDEWRGRVWAAVRVLAIVAVAASFLLAATLSAPWVPRERIQTRKGTITGYVLENTSGSLKVLVRGRHELVILPPDDVIFRDISEP